MNESETGIILAGVQEELMKIEQANKDEELFQKILNNILFFNQIRFTPEYHQSKLILVSKSLRNYNLPGVDFEFDFIGNSESSYYETYTATLAAESYGDLSSYKKRIMDHYEQVMKSIENKDDEDEEENKQQFSVQLWNQRENVLKAYRKINEVFTKEDDALGICAMLVYDFEILNATNGFFFVSFQDLFNSSNMSEKWFSGISLKRFVKNYELDVTHKALYYN